MGRRPKYFDWNSYRRSQFGDVLQRFRTDHKGMNQKEFAELLRISFQRLSDIERNRFPISVKLAIKMAKKIGEKPEDLVRCVLMDQIQKERLRLVIY